MQYLMPKLYLGDCLEVMLDLPEKSVDMILCDLPYGQISEKNCAWDQLIPFDKLWLRYERVLKYFGVIVLFGSQPFTSALVMSNPKMFKYEWIWEKSKSGSAFTAKYRPVNKHENILVFANGKTTYNPILTEGKAYTRTHGIAECDINNHGMGFNKKEVVSVNTGFRYPITVQKFQQKWRRQDQVHPTQKPVELLEYLIKTYTNEEEVVLDNCMGSGSTGVAAVNTNRRFIGIEKDEAYFKIAQNRILTHLSS